MLMACWNSYAKHRHMHMVHLHLLYCLELDINGNAKIYLKNASCALICITYTIKNNKMCIYCDGCISFSFYFEKISARPRWVIMSACPDVYIIYYFCPFNLFCHLTDIVNDEATPPRHCPYIQTPLAAIICAMGSISLAIFPSCFQ